MDARDWALFGSYASFALLLEFFPNSFTFDRYYSAPRTFRYLAPLSFPMTLHLAKMVLDLVPARAGWLALAGLLALTGLNLRQAREATAPSRAYRATLMAVVREVRARRPPMLVTEDWLSYFLSNVYLKDLVGEIQVLQISGTYSARDCEKWLQRRQSDFPSGTFLLTGFGSCVHYGAIRDGFRLALFQEGLHPAWKVLKDYGPLAYHPLPEPVRLWELMEPIPRTQPKPPDRVEGSPEELFKTGMARFDEGKPAEAAPYFHTVATDFPASAFAENAEYFYTICLFREGRWRETIAGFEELMRRRPAGRWVSAAYYHIGLSYAALGDRDRAREDRLRLAQLRAPDRDHGGHPASAGRRGRHDRRRPAGPALTHPTHARAVGGGQPGRLCAPRGAPGRNLVQAGQRRALLSRAQPAGRHPHPAEHRRLPPDRPPRGQRAEPHGRAQPVPPRPRELGRVPAGGDRVRAGPSPGGRDEVPAPEDDPLRLGRHHLVLRQAAARG